MLSGLSAIFSHGFYFAHGDFDLGRRIIVQRVLESLLRCFLRSHTIPLITVSRALDSLIHLYRQHASMSYDNSRLLSEWLQFILEEIVHAFGSSLHNGMLGALDDDQSWKAYLESVVNLVFALTDWVRSFQHRHSDIRWPHYIIPPIGPLATPPRIRCIALCGLQYVVIQSLVTVHAQRPDLRLDNESWTRLRKRLVDGASDSLANTHRVMCSTLAHRSEVRFGVLAAFDPFSPGNPGEFNTSL